MLHQAVNIATNAHDGQNRKYYDIPYITHPLEVMKMLSIWGVKDEVVLASAILHDTIEDTDVTKLSLMNNVHPTVANIVDELTYDPSKHDTKHAYLESFDKKSIEALVIKIADRLCNVIDYLNENPAYAKKYLDKAQIIFHYFNLRTKEAEQRFGARVVVVIQETYKEVLAKCLKK